MKLKPKADWSDAEVARFNEFMETTKGLHTHTVARSLGLLTPGVDWRGCTKSRLAQAWVKGCLYGRPRGLNLEPVDKLRRVIAKVTGGAA